MTLVKRKSFLKNASVITISNVVQTFTFALVGILTANYLGTEGKGQLALAMGTGIIMAQIFCFGFDQASTYFLASKRLDSARVMGSWIITIIAGLIITYGIIYPVITIWLTGNFFVGVPSYLIWIGSLSCPLYLCRLCVNRIMAGHEEFVKQTYHNITIFIATILSAVIGLVFLGYGVTNYALLSTAFGFSSLVVGFFLLKQVVPLKAVFSIKDWIQMLGYGVKSMLHEILNLVDMRLDIYIVNYFVSTAAVGIYTVGGSLASMFWLLANSISIVLLPRSSSLDMEKSRKLTAVVCRNVMWITIISGGFFLLINKPIIIFLYGESFAPASWVLAFLMPGVVGQAVSRICFTDCAAKGQPGKATIGSAITATLTVTFDLLLIPRYGIKGAAVAASIAYCSSGILGLYWHIKLSGNSVFHLLVPQKADIQILKGLFSELFKKSSYKISVISKYAESDLDK